MRTGKSNKKSIRYGAWTDALGIVCLLTVGFLTIPTIYIMVSSSLDPSSSIIKIIGVLLFATFLLLIAIYCIYYALTQFAGWIVVGGIECNVNNSIISAGSTKNIDFHFIKFDPSKIQIIALEFVYRFTTGNSVVEKVLANTKKAIIHNNQVSFSMNIPSNLVFEKKSITNEYIIRLKFNLWKLKIRREFGVRVNQPL